MATAACSRDCHISAYDGPRHVPGSATTFARCTRPSLTFAHDSPCIVKVDFTCVPLLPLEQYTSIPTIDFTHVPILPLLRKPPARFRLTTHQHSFSTPRTRPFPQFFMVDFTHIPFSTPTCSTPKCPYILRLTSRTFLCPPLFLNSMPRRPCELPCR